MSKAEKARALFMQGANCAQSVAGAFAAECGLTEEQAMIMSSGFGGGVGRLREVCGAVSGMVLVLNILYGSGNPADKAAKDAQYARIREVAAQFQEKAGTLICRELLGLGKGQEEPPRSDPRNAAYYANRPCAGLVALAAEITEKYIAEHKR